MSDNVPAFYTNRIPHYPTQHSRETVKHCVAFGLDDEQIASIIRCLPSEVKQHYADELKHGLARVNAQVQAVVLNNALYERDTQAAKLWLQNKAGWRGDGPRIGVNVGANGVAVEGDAVTITERRILIEKVLTRTSSLKRAEGRTIDSTATEVKPHAGLKRSNGGHGPRNGSDNEGATTKPDGDRLHVPANGVASEGRRRASNGASVPQQTSPGLAPAKPKANGGNGGSNGSGPNGSKHR